MGADGEGDHGAHGCQLSIDVGSLSVSVSESKRLADPVALLNVTFLSVKKSNQKRIRPCPAVLRTALRVAKLDDEAAPHAAMRRCHACSGAHNQTIAARLASLGALPDSMMLASSSSLLVRRASELAALRQADALFPSAPPMLGTGQRGTNTKTSNIAIVFRWTEGPK